MLVLCSCKKLVVLMRIKKKPVQIHLFIAIESFDELKIYNNREFFVTRGKLCQFDIDAQNNFGLFLF